MRDVQETSKECKHIGRPRVSDESGFNKRFDEAVKRFDTSELSLRKAIQPAVIDRLRDSQTVLGRS